MNIKEILKDTKKLNILYVEDSQSTRESTSIVLRDIFHEVFIAHDGVSGYDTFSIKNDEIDIIITDIQMPNMNGFEMIEKIRKKSPDIPIFVFSAYNESDYLFEAINYNISGYILKPFDLFQFLKALKIVIENINLKKNLENKIEEQITYIRQQDQMIEKQSRQAAIGEMVDAIAHQWGNPLTQISVLASTMHFQNNTQGQILKKEQITEYADNIMMQVEHMSETLNEFRDFFKPSKNHEKINLLELIKQTLTLVQDELKNNQINYTLEGDNTIEVEIIPNEFKHVLLNFISNSRFAFEENNIDSRNIKFEITQDENNIYLNFSDNAGGVPLSIIDTIFNPNVTTKKEKGTGVGLYLSKQIIEKIHGELTVINNDNDGATFTVALKHP